MKKNESISLINSDCLTALKDITSQSVDLILTDPPYNLGLFMQNRDTNLKKMRDNFFGAADWDNLDYESWKASLEIFFGQAARICAEQALRAVYNSETYQKVCAPKDRSLFSKPHLCVRLAKKRNQNRKMQ